MTTSGRWWFAAVSLIACLSAGASRAAELLPLQPGMVVVTQKAASPPWVLRIIDLRDIECTGAVHGSDWTASPDDTNELPNPTGRPEDQWVLANFGGDELFGLALDDSPEPDIYATPTISFRGDSNVASGRVWRVDGTTGAISVFAVLPNTGVGLGNIGFDGRNRQFFVSNMEDGKIYRLDMTGTVLDTFDPFLPDSGAAGMPPLGDRVWAVDVFQNRLYFGTWTEDTVRRLGIQNEVWSIALDDCGAFSGPAQLEITMPDVGGHDFSTPVTDLAFSQDGRMLVAGRSLESDFSTDAHLAVVREYELAGAAWVSSGNTFQVGGGTDAGGGVDYVECVPTATCSSAASHALATGDRLVGSGGNSVHGLQVFPIDGGTPDDSYVIHYSPGKRGIGDVEAVRHDGCLVVPPACAIGVDVAITTAPCEPVHLAASTPLLEHCCGNVEYRFTAPDGTASDWSVASSHDAAVDGEWQVEARCDVEPACLSTTTADVALVSSPGPQATLETMPATDCSRDRLVLHVVPDSWGTCSAPTFQWLEDGVPVPGAIAASFEVPASTPAGSHSYAFVVTCPEALPCGDASTPLVIDVVDPPPGPQLTLEITPAMTCARDTYLLEVVAGSFGECSAPGYEWLEDGVVVPGTSGSRFFVPETTPAGDHAYQVRVTCPEPLRCGDTSPPMIVRVEDPSGTPRATVSETTPPDCTRPTVTLQVVPSSIGPCSAPAFQWYEGGVAIPGATGNAYVVPSTAVVGDHAYHFVVTCPEALPCGDTSEPVVVEVRDASGPLIDVVETPRNCERPSVVLSLIAGSFGACSAPTYQWTQDGSPIPGATGTSHELAPDVPVGPHDYAVVVGCPEPLRCGDTSNVVGVLVADPPTGPVLELEVTPPVGCARAAYTVRAVPGSFGPCTFPFFEWWQDGVVVPDEYASSLVVSDSVPAGSHVYSVRAFCSETLPCDRSADLAIVIEDPPPGPAMDVVRTAGGPCVPGDVSLVVVPGSFGACSAPAYQWWRDGAPIPGATSDTWRLPPDEPFGDHEYWYVVTCPEALICGDQPAHEIVHVTGGSPLEGLSLDGLLYVTKRAPASLRLLWTDAAADATSYSIYMGAIGSWYSHGPLACHVPRTPPGAAQTEHVDRVPPRDAYFLVGMNDCLGQGTIGANSFGVARPLSPAAPACGPEP